MILKVIAPFCGTSNLKAVNGSFLISSGISMFLSRLTYMPFAMKQTGTTSLSFAVSFPHSIVYKNPLELDVTKKKLSQKA